jgi:hypothetical protein
MVKFLLEPGGRPATSSLTIFYSISSWWLKTYLKTSPKTYPKFFGGSGVFHANKKAVIAIAMTARKA